MKTPSERFAEKFLLGAPTDCWPWVAKINRGGYGQISVLGRLVSAHRFSYELFRGAIPGGLEIDHLCRNRRCVNPRHLEPVTKKVNQERGLYASATHCKHAHEFSGGNLYVRPNGRRTCRRCNADSQRKRKARGGLA